MILTPAEADQLYGSLKAAQSVSAASTINFHAHKKGRVIVRHTQGFGVVVEAYSNNTSPIPYCREIYDNNQHFASSYGV